jgi:hypothetical protein
MANPIEVSDSGSNTEENIERAAKIIGRGQARPKVFEAIYHHKSRVKTASAIQERTGLPRVRVLQEGRRLVQNGLVKSANKNGEVAYEMIDFYQTNKARILRYAADPKKLEALPTKRKSAVAVTVNQPASAASPKAVAITIDDIDSFMAVRDVHADGHIPPSVSEEQFKRGVQAILGEAGEWKDWGGELFDLAAPLVLRGRRLGAVFAFKGPGQKGPLVPGKMGKNGDQIARMFMADARIFVVQYVREIKPSINAEMRSFAVDKSAMTDQTIYYAVIDGTDSDRLYRAYPDAFASAV